jgi:hypothetical protein
VTEPNDLTNRILRLRSELTPEGIRFYDEYERRINAATNDLDKMRFQAWVAEQLPTLSEHDRDIVMRAIQLHALQVFGGISGEDVLEELVEDAQNDSDSARSLIAGAQQLQVYKGEPLSPDMDLREAHDVLRRLLFDQDL